MLRSVWRNWSAIIIVYFLKKEQLKVTLPLLNPSFAARRFEREPSRNLNQRRSNL